MIAPIAPPIVTLPPRTMLALGAPALTDLSWRTRAGQAEYQRARAAEKSDDWATVVEACNRARGIDETHLDAAWLQAVGQARLGHLDAIIEPLERATSGDWGKWGERALTAPVFAAFRATPVGRSWVASADAYRAAYAQTLARGFLLIVDGDIVAYDATSARWLRVTRSGGSIIAALRGAEAHQVAYVARLRDAKRVGVRIGAVDLTTDVATADGDHELVIDGTARLQLSWRRGATGPWLELMMPTATLPRGATVKDAKASVAAARGPWMLDLVHGQRVAASDHGPRSSPELIVERGRVHVVRLPRNDLVADWDEHGLAGAIRVGHADRTVAAPDASMIDGNTVAFAPGGASLLFVTASGDPCAPPAPTAAPDAAAPIDTPPSSAGEIVVVELATGIAHRIADAPRGVQVDWLDDHRIAATGGSGFSVYRTDGTIDDTMPVNRHAVISLWGRPAAIACASAVAAAAPDDPLPAEDPASFDDDDDRVGDKRLSGN